MRATTLDGSNLYTDYDVVCNVDKEATSIAIVERDDLKAVGKIPTVYYDLMGLKVLKPVKGHLYITNKGQKVVY